MLREITFTAIPGNSSVTLQWQNPDDIDFAVDRKQDYAQAWSNRGDIYRDIGDRESARQVAIRLKERYPNNGPVDALAASLLD